MLRVCDTDNDEGLDSFELINSDCLEICEGLFGLTALDMSKLSDAIDKNTYGIMIEPELKMEIQKIYSNRK